MDMITFYRISGVFIIIVSLGFTISQMGITKIFNYPQILRSPVNIILQKFHEGGAKLKFFWICFALSSLMLIPMSAIFYKILNRNDTPYLMLGATFGIAAGIFYALGLMRWVFLADNLSKRYIDENTKPKMKETLEIIFQSFHIYCGNSIGETMGFLCMGMWISITGISMIRSVIFHPLIGIGFIVSGIGILTSPWEWLGFKLSNKINKLSLKILMVLLIFAGTKLIIY